jgi:hypothetical protein
MNIVVLKGSVVADPETRSLSTGPAIQFDVTTVVADASITVPVSWPHEGPNLIAQGDTVVVAGVVRRRFFRSAGRTISRTEVEADTVIMASDKRAVGRLITKATAGLSAVKT